MELNTKVSHLSQTAPLSNPVDCPVEKGKAFEQYVRSLFNQKSGRFAFIEASTYQLEGFSLFAARLTYPDFKIVFRSRYGKYRFAVECKWRQSLPENGFQLAPRNTILRYYKFQKENNITVFVAIGIGGSPSNPEKLFVTPLSHIMDKPQLTEKDLMLFKRHPQYKFFYDARQLKLFL